MTPERPRTEKVFSRIFRRWRFFLTEKSWRFFFTRYTMRSTHQPFKPNDLSRFLKRLKSKTETFLGVATLFGFAILRLTPITKMIAFDVFLTTRSHYNFRPIVSHNSRELPS